MDNVPVHSNNQGHVERNIGGRPAGAVRGKKLLKMGRLKITMIAVGVVLAAAVIVLSGLFMYQTSTSSAIDNSKYQVVFLTENSFYFGKLHTLNSDYMRLTDIYYIQSKTDSTNPQGTDTQASNSLELIKLGNEIHGPVDEMIISKDKILYFENLKSDSKVSKLIADYQNQKK